MFFQKRPDVSRMLLGDDLNIMKYTLIQNPLFLIISRRSHVRIIAIQDLRSTENLAFR